MIRARVDREAIVSYHIKTLVWEVLPLCRDAVGVFYSPNQLGHVFDWNTW